MPTKRKIKVVHKKLGRQKAWGQAADYIEIDSRANGKKHLEILVHEAIHILIPILSEDAVTGMGVILANTIWDERYRRVDNSNEIPLQDGLK